MNDDDDDDGPGRARTCDLGASPAEMVECIIDDLGRSITDDAVMR